ncbi:hypothetical protein HHL21_14510 [Massilia sp. RP-1-19]|uniref:Uncharacterized protein n=1 Tax=Massilia polaris TaxID=2728846 RepID=A0A848HK85_9BURK|nr:hypothetical protein [Massilia polaris]NML62266.1 hypothetical protein [Massilia polaris]
MTLREAYIEGLIADLRAAAGIGAMVERSIVKAFTREEDTVLVVHRGAESQPDNSRLGVIDRTCEILLSIVARGDAPDQLADAVLEVAHPLVMAYRAPRIIDVWEGPTDAPKFSDVGGTAGLITVHYFIRYRSGPNSLSS